MSEENNDQAEVTETPTYMTADDMNTALNNALRNRMKRVESNLLDKFGEMLSDRLGVKTDEPAEGIEAPAQGDAQLPAEVAKQLKSQQKLIEKLTKESEESKKLALEKEAAINRQQEREALRNLLVTGGVKEAMVEDLVDAKMARGVVGRDDYGDIVWKHKDEILSLDEGVASFLKTEKAKHYLPAGEGSGSGNTGGSRDRKGGPGGMTDDDFMSHVL